METGETFGRRGDLRMTPQALCGTANGYFSPAILR